MLSTSWPCRFVFGISKPSKPTLILTEIYGYLLFDFFAICLTFCQARKTTSRSRASAEGTSDLKTTWCQGLYRWSKRKALVIFRSWNNLKLSKRQHRTLTLRSISQNWLRMQHGKASCCRIAKSELQLVVCLRNQISNLTPCKTAIFDDISHSWNPSNTSPHLERQVEIMALTVWKRSGLHRGRLGSGHSFFLKISTPIVPRFVPKPLQLILVFVGPVASLWSTSLHRAGCP